MAIPKQRQMSVAEFTRFIARPENKERRWELIAGEVIEVPSNPYSSQVAALIIAALVMFVRPRNLGHITGEAAGYMVNGQPLSPDVAFVSKERQTTMPYHEQYNPIAPDLMVEILSPTDKTDKRAREAMENKIRLCADAGILLWIVDPEPHSVIVHDPGQPVRTLNIDDSLDGGNILPGFILLVKDIFPEY